MASNGMSPQVIELCDEAKGTTAKIVASYGFNCFSFQAVLHGERHEVLWSAPNFERDELLPSRSGTPLLFPWPGRIRGTEFTFEGKTYRVQAADDKQGNAIHGFVNCRRWKVVESTPHKVVGRFVASQVEPNILQWWPSDFSLTVTYELQGNTLNSQLRVDNPGPGRLPFGLGTHAYFRVPLGAGGQADDCVVTVPAAAYWEMEKLLPTGKQLPATAGRDLRQGLPFHETKLDDVLGQLTFSDGRCVTSIYDPQLKRRLTLSFSDGFRECVVFNPPHREAICIEPYTCVPDPFTLTARGIDPGLRILDPGQSFTVDTSLQISAE